MLGLSALGDLAEIQAKLGVPQTNEWDRATLAAISSFQGVGRGELGMHVTGVPDPSTLINLGYYDPVEMMPRRYAEYVSGNREAPGTFGRDLATLSNQIPQWVWVVAGVAMLSLGYYVYRKNKGSA